MMNFYPYTKGEYKVVEINNVVALRSGQIIAQTPFVKANNAHFANKDVIDNGYILCLGLNGELVLPGNANAMKDKLVLHYTEELFLGNTIQLNSFAVPFEDGVAYPRGLVINVGDTFTTNNVADEEDIEDGIFNVDNNGQFTPADGSTPAGHLFRGVLTTLPDAVTPALELTYLGFK